MSTATLTAREQLEKLAPELDAYAAEVGAKAAPSGEELQKLKEMGDDVIRLMNTVKETAKASYDARAALAFIDDFGGTKTTSNAFSVADLASKSGIVDPQGMTLGEAFATSPAYQEFVKGYKGANGSIMNIPVQKAANFEVGDLYTKTPIFGLSDTSAGAFVTTQRLGQSVDLIGERRLTVRDLCTNITITSDTFDYVTVTGKTNAAAPVLEATTSATPGLNNVAVGAYTAAHGVKPESALTFAVVSSIVETIAHMIPISRRAAADGGQIMQMVNAFLLYGLREEEEDQILNGSGTTPQLRGLYNVVGINTVGSAGTDIDAVVDAIAAIRADNNEPTGLIIHPNDWFSTGFLLAKDTAGNYIIGDPRASLDQLNSIWGLRVVVTPAATENTALVGDFRKVVVADRQQGTIYMTDSHTDHFARNILDILAEERIGLGCLDPEALCTITAL